MNTATALKVEGYADRVVRAVEKASDITLKFICVVATVTGSVVLAFALFLHMITQNAGTVVGKMFQAMI